MVSYVALLRGIGPSNPNMRNEKLRGVFDRLAQENVRSVISSGNILFESGETDVSSLEARIEEALLADLGITSTTIIRSHQELQDLVSSDPFEDLTHERRTYLTVTFLKDRRQSLLQEAPALPPDQAFRIVGIDPNAGALCAVTDTTRSKTPDFMRLLEKALGKDITTRTWKTVQRILTKMS